MNGIDVALAALAITATISATLVWLLKKLFEQNDGTLKEVVKSNSSLAASINKLAQASETQTRAIERQEKNNEEWQKYVTTRFDNLDNIGGMLLGQNASEQRVEHQTIVNR